MIEIVHLRYPTDQTRKNKQVITNKLNMNKFFKKYKFHKICIILLKFASKFKIDHKLDN